MSRAIKGIRLGVGWTLCLAFPVWADQTVTPPLDRKGQEAYVDYQRAEGHRAFALAPGGVWAWRGEMPSPEAAKGAVLADCKRLSGRRCLAYGVDGAVVFAPRAWREALRPYPSAEQGRRATVGRQPGQRFPDLRLTDPEGRHMALSDLRGRVVLLHFWGSWCPHCVAELPELQALAGQLRKDDRVSLILVPVREQFAQARDWARRRGLALPLYDGGETVPSQNALRVADGGLLPDRWLAAVFPTTYLLDRQGLVLFAHQGPVPAWPAYASVLRDIAEHSGRARGR